MKGFIILLVMVVNLMVCCAPATSEMNTSIEVSAHYNGADATVIQVTDQYFPSYHFYVRDDTRKFSSAWAEFLAFKYNIPLHVFEQNVKGSMFKAFLQTGRGGASVYYPSCSVPYRKSKLDSIIAEIGEVYGRTPTTLSYGCGKLNYTDSLPTYILGARTSNAIPIGIEVNAITWYGNGLGVAYQLDFSQRQQILKYPAGGRFYTDIIQKNIEAEEAANFVKEQVSIAVNTNGFYTNFMHWHDYAIDNDKRVEGVAVMEPLFKAMEMGLKGSRNSYLDYNEAIEYLYAKEAVDTIKKIEVSHKQLKLVVQHSNKRDADYTVIKTPVTLKIPKDALGKYDIMDTKQNDTIISIFQDKNNFYLNVLLNYDRDSTTVSLINGEDRYIIDNLEKKLKIREQNFSKSITTNIPSKFVLFRRKQGVKIYEIELIDRRLNFSEKYKPPNFQEGYDYFCGAITRTRQSALIHIKN
ncbi:hypothetical protein G5B37_10185 [Rasiella rasia]|uniref:Solute-binding protein family 3/N-terminal domain-containing protein n=1 Tax=Rasiella rasia TaxID=2744027 RepID=A0A6G6GMY8_9FLAO|nr:hypothetical protein [Rasiella rasia]QIE59919.1 hypothetical protein G5B37_10185 [Rasiella rasia]